MYVHMHYTHGKTIQNQPIELVEDVRVKHLLLHAVGSRGRRMERRRAVDAKDSDLHGQIVIVLRTVVVS